ncbi:MAG: ParB/RepB/Spo0J family partition protein [Gemmobacter sp.]|nr:ParB/RepB/Spo0J family partition protein [Gemmobacter sp.]
MEKKMERRGLGRGLSALMADISPGGDIALGPAVVGRRTDLLAIERLRPNADQPRQAFSQENLEDLAASIRRKGILQPIIVRSIPDTDSYEIVAGERRWRAAQIAQLHEVPVIIRDFNDQEVLEIALIENIQRADLNAIEEATAYRQLMDRFNHTQEQLAVALSKSRSHIANLLRLLSLPEDVKGLVKNGALSAGHARALVTSPRASTLAKTIVDRGLSVRETEDLVRKPTPERDRRAGGGRGGDRDKDADTRALESDLSANLRMLVTIKHEGNTGKGVISVRYNSLDDLDLLCRVLSQIPRDTEF